MLLDHFADRYSRTARLLPALFVALPLSILVLTAIPSEVNWWGRVSSILLASGAPIIVAQIVRDLGRRKEVELFAAWGGPPTTIFLRWSGPEAQYVQRRRHELLSRTLGVELPSTQEESVDPEDADVRYAVAITALRERTRDEAQFPLVAKEVTIYGFRRNLLGCRPLGLLASGVAATATAVLFLTDFLSPSPALMVTLILFDALCALIWWRLVTPTWVRNAADTYAQHLLACVEALAAKGSI